MIRMSKSEQKALSKLPEGVIGLLVLLYEIAEHEDGYILSSQKWMSKRLNRSERTISKKIAKLKALGVLEVGFGMYESLDMFCTLPYTYKINRKALKEVSRG